MMYSIYTGMTLQKVVKLGWIPFWHHPSYGTGTNFSPTFRTGMFSSPNEHRPNFYIDKTSRMVTWLEKHVSA